MRASSGTSSRDRGPGTSALAVGAAPAPTSTRRSPARSWESPISSWRTERTARGSTSGRNRHPRWSSRSHTYAADPSLTVGSAVAKAASKIGVVVDLTGVERQALARYTQDAGNNVSLSVRPAAACRFAENPLRRRCRRRSRTACARRAAAAVTRAARCGVLHRQRRERGGRGRDHAQARQPDPGRRRRRDHARQPHVAALRDQLLPRNLRDGDPARELLGCCTRQRSDGRRRRGRDSGGRNQCTRLALHDAGDLDVRDHRRTRRGGERADQGDRRRRPRRGDERKDCPGTLARRPCHRGTRDAHPRPRPPMHASSAEALRR